jgi:hypothetical protein
MASSTVTREQADAKFAKTQKAAREAAKAAADYGAENGALRLRTAKLKEQRLAMEAVALKEAEDNPPKKAAPKKRAVAKKA